MASEPINPYAPPAADPGGFPGVAPPGLLRGPMFSAMQIGWAAFFGSLFAGVLLLQANYRTMGRHAAANAALALGLPAGVLLQAVLLIVPKGVPLPVNFAVTWSLYKLAVALQGDAYFKHTIAGGGRHSNWLVFVIILVTFVAFVAALVMLRSVIFRSRLFLGMDLG